VPSVAATNKRLRKQVADAGDALWRPIALTVYSDLTTTLTFFPGLISPYKLVFRRLYEAEHATTVSDPPEVEVPLVTLDDYVFRYDIIISGEIKETWTGKASFRNLGAANDAHVLLPLSEKIAEFFGEQVDRLDAVQTYPNGDPAGINRIRLRTTITEIKTLKTATIVSYTQGIDTIDETPDNIVLEEFPVAHRVSGLVGVLIVEAHLRFIDARSHVREGTDAPGACFIELRFRRDTPMYMRVDNLVNLYLTQNKFLLELQYGSIFKYRTAYDHRLSECKL
jgi:hypothetical protein